MKLDNALAEKLRHSLGLLTGDDDDILMNILSKLKNFDIDLKFVSADRFS